MKLTNYEIISLNDKRYFSFPFAEDFGFKLILSSSDVNRAQDSPLEKAIDVSAACKALDTTCDYLFSCHQMHTDNIALIKEKNPKAKIHPYLGHEFEATDGLITDRDFILATKFADCTPIVIFDRKNRVIANLHSGWRGTQKKILVKAIRMLQDEFHSNSSDLVVFIGPALASCDFEVGRDLVELFEKSHGDISAYLKTKTNGRYLFDMKALIVSDLLAEGICDDNIYTTALSTFRNDLMHSFRRDGDSSGRMLLFSRLI